MMHICKNKANRKSKSTCLRLLPLVGHFEELEVLD